MASTIRTARGMGVSILLLAAAFLQACGGGGGGGSSAPEATLTVARSSLVFDAEQGDEIAPQTIQGSLTGVQSPVTVFIEYTDRGIGTSVFTSTGATTGTLIVTPKFPAWLAPGVYNDTITVRACYDASCSRQTAGSPRQVSVSYTVRRAAPAPVLEASERGVALVAVPGGQRLSHSVTIAEASGTSTGWSASSDAAWLSVTPSGSIGAALLLSADPATLAEGAHFATVTVRSNGGATVRDETVRVGFYKSSTAPAARLADPLEAYVGAQLVSDPVRPIMYSVVGGTIAAQHFYTGARVGTITLPSVAVTALAISDDGRTLYALNGGGSDAGITLIDLDSFQVSGRLPPSNELLIRDASRMAFARVAGQPVLVLNQGSHPTGFTRFTPIVNAVSGAQVGTVTGFNGWSYTQFEAARGGVIYSADMGITGGGLRTTRIQLRANSHRVYDLVAQTPPESVSTSLLDFAAHPDGSKVIHSYYNGIDFKQAVFNGTGLAWSDSGPPNVAGSSSDVEFLADGRYVTVSGNTLRLYGLDNTEQFQWVGPAFGTSPFGGYAGTIRISSDGLWLLGNGVFVELPR